MHERVTALGRRPRLCPARAGQRALRGSGPLFSFICPPCPVPGVSSWSTLEGHVSPARSFTEKHLAHAWMAAIPRGPLAPQVWTKPSPHQGAGEAGLSKAGCAPGASRQPLPRVPAAS